ncbi:protein TRANSPARENT TESTA 9 isoform X1 [Ziziphus jujuba]|uniref:Protein TRANSPARENT TESTA 9 isoform X1 n=2 Tax=Ziziphus jujuba TaxID=326968 RepID=A0A6P4BIA7_ZIZJJ|nr:protein TRANSPARENT TESTA 9 isoform X1 [Ziziphus jujuba]
MWRSLWRSIDRFSLQYFKYIINELRAIKVVDMHNKELVVDLLQSIVEIVTYGDRQDPMIFECFMEYQVLAEFVRVLKISRNSKIEAPLLQYLSIMIQNMDSEHAIYYCFSNDYINNIIAHEYDFNGGDLAPYFVSFLRAVSGKLNRDTLCLLVKVHGDAVVSFPLYNEALKFSHHEEKMIQTAIRALTLSIYNVSDDMVYQYITTPPVSKYFSNLVLSLKEQCLHLDALVLAEEETFTRQKRKELLLETDKIVDDLYYIKDIIKVGEFRLSRLVTENLLSLLVFPLLQFKQSNGSKFSTVTSLFLVSRLLQVIGGKDMINSVAATILCPYMSSSVRNSFQGNTAGEINYPNSLFEHLNKMESMVCSVPECEGEENITCPNDEACKERSGILDCIFSENQSLLLASLFLLLIIAESKDLDYFLAPIIGISGMHDMAVMDGNILVRFMDQILNALLTVLVRQPPFSVQTQWHIGWFLRKLLTIQGKMINDYNLQLFNTSLEQSCECVRKELDGCWFDHMPEAFGKEWASCNTALEESSQLKDPFLSLELAVGQQTSDGDTATHHAWHRMVEAVKVFILHLQLKSSILTGNLLEYPLLNSVPSTATDSGRTHASDVSSASFGSEVSLGSGTPCRISFSNAGIRDVYLIPVARGISGKLLLAEKHPFRSQRGVVLAIAPLAGLDPKIDEAHPTWLHLRIREFDPKFVQSKIKGHRSEMSSHLADGRWILGFPSNKACEAAQLLILEEIRKQRSSVESLLSPLLRNYHLENLSNGHDKQTSHAQVC